MRSDNMILYAGSLVKTPLLDRLAPTAAASFTGISVFATECAALAEQGISLAEQRKRINDVGLDVAEVEIVAKWLPNHRPQANMPAWSSEGMMNLTPEAILPIAAELGASSVVVAEAFGTPFDAELMAEGFAATCDTFQTAGINVAFEFISNTTVSTLEQAAEIVRLANRDNGGILLDSFHLFRGGSSLETLRSLPGSAIKSIQLSDAPIKLDDSVENEMIRSRLLPGDGVFNLRGLIDILDEIGCTARVGLEIFSESLATLPASAIANRCAIAARKLLEPQEAGATASA